MNKAPREKVIHGNVSKRYANKLFLRSEEVRPVAAWVLPEIADSNSNAEVLSMMNNNLPRHIHILIFCLSKHNLLLRLHNKHFVTAFCYERRKETARGSSV